MQLQEHINETLDNLESTVNEKEEKQRVLELQRAYRGSDQLVSAADFKKEVIKEQVLYVAQSGLPGLDQIIGGFRPGTVIIVSGPTKQGKTTLCQTLTYNFTTAGFKCLWFSFDTPPIELIERFGDRLPLFYLPRRTSPEKKLEWLEQKIVEGIAKFNTRIVFIDHLGFISHFTTNTQNYATELTQVVRAIKEIAMRWQLTIFLNHHIRQIDANLTPNWSHLKDSSGVAQDSDITVLVWREKKKSDVGIEYTDCSYVSVQLHRRTGKTGVCKVRLKDGLLETATPEVTDVAF